ncbi:hypothetical protein Baya_4537 [Bagarius yarrelli]|uniref:Uncharacterized protein n=1 Tax=Bagarius yarrelli TaxID=175774 RepID=A0A556TR42_BAGYA|nr:hypothetical protein Baya_4537 [Bagarius yarrelli]
MCVVSICTQLHSESDEMLLSCEIGQSDVMSVAAGEDSGVKKYNKLEQSLKRRLRSVCVREEEKRDGAEVKLQQEAGTPTSH